MVTLGFVGDVMLGRLVDDHQRRRSVERVWGDVLPRLRALDGLFVNLECCLSMRGERWTGTHHPFHFRADPDWAIPALKRVGVDFANLANNHLGDYGDVALLDTVDALDDAGIAHAGAGEDVATAREPAVVSVGALDVAVVSFTDNTPEFAAGKDAPGTAYVEMDAGNDRTRRVVGDALAAARETAPDLLVASLHWGPNMRERPPPAFREFAHWLTGEGVDVIHGHSAHVFQGVEVADGTLVLYDTGDFVDDYAVNELHNDRGFLFEVEVAEATAELRELRLSPTEIYDYAVHDADPDAAEWSRRQMRRLSSPFGTEFASEGEELVLEL